MVELEEDDYLNILRWFEYRFANTKPEDIASKQKRTFWKLTFLAEDKAKADKLENQWLSSTGNTFHNIHTSHTNSENT